MKWSSEFLKKKLADGIAGWWKPLVESAIVGLFAFFSYCEIGGIPLWPALVAGILLALSVIGAIVVYRDEKTRPNKIRYRRISKFLARLADQAARSGIIREELVQITAKAQAAIFGGIGEEEGNRFLNQGFIKLAKREDAAAMASYLLALCDSLELASVVQRAPPKS